MKKITRFYLLLVAIIASGSMGFAATTTIDFETIGNTWNWSTFEANPTWSIVANPSATGINTSANVGKFVAKVVDQPWAGVQCAHGDFGPLTVTASNFIIKIMVYKDVISPVGIKLVIADGGSQGELKVSNTKINEWEELTFDFTQQIRAGWIIDQIVVFPDFNARTTLSTSYIDNIVYTKDVVAEDLVAPTDFSATLGTVSASNVVLKLKATDNSGTVKYTISYGAITLNATGASNVEMQFSASSLSPSTPYSFSVICKDAAGNVAANSPIVVQATTSAAFVLPAAVTPDKLPANVMSLYSDTYTAAATITGYDNWWNMGFSDYTFTAGGTAKGFTTTGDGNCGGPNFAATPLDISSMTSLHIDVYPTSPIDVGLKLVTVAHGETPLFLSLGMLTPNQWNSKDILLSAFGVTNLTDLKQIGFVTTASFGTFYMDNLYFWKVGTGINHVSATAISCYPNPVATNLTISAKSEMSNITVRNLLGQVVKSEMVKGSTKTIDLSGLSTGTYFMEAKMSNGQVSTQKISKK